ncbi:MAG TPA: DUF58 domain-containing protein [Micromonosporaceae bacterium]|nr:DUF58 domain-containing protein [Micromonosporaceae bacterium]
MPTRALGRSIVITGLLLVTAVVLGRVDLVVLAAPFALGSALALRRRPVGRPAVQIAVAGQLLAEGGELAATVSVGNQDVVGYDLVVLRTGISRWLDVHHGDRPYLAPVGSGQIIDVALGGQALRWGRHAFGPATVRAVACDGLLVSPLSRAPARGVKVYPLTEPFDAAEAMPRAAGLVGGHRSRRPGEGGELAGVRVFGPGDRLRRIDWRVSLRTRQLHVAATLSDRDAEVVLLLDVLREAGRSGGVHGAASVLDTTVRAAAGIAEHYLHRGDRVAMLEYGFRARRLRPASGRRQYVTALEWLLDTRATPTQYEPTGPLFGAHLLPANALVVVLTPLLDQRTAAMLARLARVGRFLVAVDTLPPGIRAPNPGEWAQVAERLWRLERENVIGALREYGVPVVAWAGAGSLDEVLRDVSRLAAAPKVVFR